MSEESVWLGIAKSSVLSVPQLVRWRDTEIASRTAALPHQINVNHYSAFNVTCAATVATFNVGQPTLPSFVNENSIEFQSLTAIKKSEFAQPGVSDPIGQSPILYSVMFRVPQPWQAEFDDWYDQEHMPMIFACKEWGLTRRYHFPSNPDGWTHLALHYVLDAKAFDAPALKAARLTPWRAKFLQERWFTDVDKMIYFKQAAETPAELQKAS